MEFDKKDIESSIHVLSGLLGYSERMGCVTDITEKEYCKKDNECPAKHIRGLYEAALRTAISILNHYLTEN